MATPLCDNGTCAGLPVYTGACVTRPVYCQDNELVTVRQACGVGEIAATFSANNGGVAVPDLPADVLLYPRNQNLELNLQYANGTCWPVTFQTLLRFTFSLIQDANDGILYFFQTSYDAGVSWQNNFSGRWDGAVSENVYMPFDASYGPVPPGSSINITYRQLIFKDPNQPASTNNPGLFEVTGLAALQHGTSMEPC